MIAVDYSLPVRRAVLPLLKASPDVTRLVPAERVYPSTVPANPTFPFTRYGTPAATPFRLSGLGSSTVRFKIHGFAKDRYDDSRTLLSTAEDGVMKLAAVVCGTLDGRVIAIEGGMRATLSFLGSSALPDGGEPDAWHAVVDFIAEVAG